MRVRGQNLTTPYRDFIHTFTKCKAPCFHKMMTSSCDQIKFMLLTKYFFSNKGKRQHVYLKGDSYW